VLKLTATTASLLLNQPRNTISADEYLVHLATVVCGKADERTLIYYTNKIILKNLRANCTYSAKIRCKNILTEYMSEASTAVELKTQAIGE